MVDIRGRGAVHFHIAGVQKRRLLQRGSYGDVKCYARFRNHTPSVEGSAAPPKL